MLAMLRLKELHPQPRPRSNKFLCQHVSCTGRVIIELSRLGSFTPCLSILCLASFKALIPWKEFTSRLGALSSQQLEAIAVDLLQRQAAVYPQLAGAARRELDAAQVMDDLATELVRVLLWLREQIGYTSCPTDEKAFAIESYVWDRLAFQYHAAYRSIEDGIFAINIHDYRPNSIEREVANRPLFIEAASAISVAFTVS
jgi:hypothetical protein